MIELGLKSEIFGADQLQRVSMSNDMDGRPARMPKLDDNKSLICGYDQGLGERMFVCGGLEDVHELYDAYARGGALRIHWYSGEDPGFITVIGAGPK